MSEPTELGRRRAMACQTCNGSSRATTGLVCQSCGWDYGRDGEPSVPAGARDWIGAIDRELAKLQEVEGPVLPAPLTAEQVAAAYDVPAEMVEGPVRPSPQELLDGVMASLGWTRVGHMGEGGIRFTEPDPMGEVYALTNPEVELLIEALGPDLGPVQVCIDGGLKFKIGESSWSPPLGRPC